MHVTAVRVAELPCIMVVIAIDDKRVVFAVEPEVRRLVDQTIHDDLERKEGDRIVNNRRIQVVAESLP